ncbi:hypothetical protein ACOSQ2_001585 [Xanthoceras sorbifolium]
MKSIALPLPLPSSIKLQTNCNPGAVSYRVCSLFATANATYNNKPIEISLRTSPNRLVREQVRFKEYENGTTLKEGLENEVETIVQRLKTAVETIIDLEVHKFTSKVDGELSFADRRILIEEMSSEIVRKFWEKPVQYLASGDGNIEKKLKHLHVLVRMLEQSCQNNKR